MLYGGVSMAIYMYGVVYEIWRVVRASKALENDSEDLGNPWTEVLRGCERRVTLDIVSGTSAGGINGILLGRALASGGDLATARDVWLEKADFKELLTRERDEPKSLLRSGFFKQELEEAIEAMGTDPSKRLVDVLDVFVSTTHLGGDRRDFYDSLGHRLATKRHDVPVRLRYRNSDKFAAALGVPKREKPGDAGRNDFDKTSLLVQVAQATSAFPFAFEPVKRAAAEHDNDEWSAGDYTDGGVTNNKPFEQTLDAIFGRAAERPVGRWLLSVDPDPKPPKPASTIQPDFLDVVAAATLSIPRYESIQQDLDRLYDHRKKVRTFWEVALDGLEGAVAAGTADWVSDAHYAALRQAALVNFLAEEYRRARQNSAILDGRATWLEDLQRISSELLRAAPGWEALDVAFELRRAYYVIKLLGREAEASGHAEALIPARQEMWQRFEAARNTAWEAVRTLLDPVSPVLNVEALADGVSGSGETPEELIGLANARAAFDRYALRDRALLAGDPFGFRMPRDDLDHAEINPSAAHALDHVVSPEKRLAGDTLAHFGGFLERRWRENDILWGRLDSADVLVRALASDSGTDPKGSTEAVQRQVVCELLEPEDPDEWHAALQAANPAGEEDVGDISGRRLSRLALRSGRVAQRMFGSLSPSKRSPGAAFLRFVLKPLGFVVFKALTPLLFLVTLAFGRGKVMVRLLAAFALLPATVVTLCAVIEAFRDQRQEFAIFAVGWAISIVAGHLAARGMAKEPESTASDSPS